MADLDILVTTRTPSMVDSNKDFSFFLNDQRVIVALSRCKQGFIIVGDFEALLRSSLRIYFMSEALKICLWLLWSISRNWKRFQWNKKGLMQWPGGVSMLSPQLPSSMEIGMAKKTKQKPKNFKNFSCSVLLNIMYVWC